MIVEKGDMVPMCVENFGYKRQEVEEDGIYLGADYGVITLSDIEDAVKDLKKLRLRRQYEKDEHLEKKYAEQCSRTFGEENQDG
jgi:alpha-ketoglutarate-dependent taurine dioxygenase